MLKFIKICFLVALMVGGATAQTTKSFSPKVQNLFEYELSLRSYYRKLWTSQRDEFMELNQKSVMNYLPDLGLQFGLPSINFRISDYVRYQHDQRVTTQKLKSIDEKLELELNAAIQDLRIEYEKLRLEFDRLQTAKEKMTFVSKLYEIGLECCNKRQCTPEECRKKELDFFSEKQVLKEQEINFDIMILEFEKIAKYKLPDLKFN